jgi:hypothetical protein
MNLKKIIIYENEILFNILSEIKDNLNYDLINIGELNFEKSKKFLNEDYLVITKENNDNFKNQITIDRIPIKITKLIELINLKLLKEKFNSQSHVTIGAYKLNLNSREISKDKINIDLTEREINLILFLKKSKAAVKIDELEKKVWDYESDLETHTVETHIYRLRKKIKDNFGDEKFILSLKKGYLIN